MTVDANDPEMVTEALDRLSLQQALLDVEIANARVVDLTKRLLDAHDEVKRRTFGLEQLGREHEALRAEVAAIHASRSYRLAVKLAETRRLLRG